MPKVSIIVPVYKAEKYLRRCIDSIITQTFTDWELLLIDDGSPDDSGKICDEYAIKDKRIRVFHKENGGVSSARNLALDYCQGEWIMFLDADDTYDINAIRICLNVAKKFDLDIVQTSVTRDLKCLGNIGEIESTVASPENYFCQKKYRTTVWGGLIKANLFQEHHIRFDQKLKLAEDQKCIFTCMACAKRIKRINNQLYYYRPNEAGATFNQQTKDLIKSMKALTELKVLYPVLHDAIDVSQINILKQIIRNNDISLTAIVKLYNESMFKDKNTDMPNNAELLQKIASYNIGFAMIFQKILTVIKR